jgi:acetolactate synthase I/II/III large subunit
MKVADVIVKCLEAEGIEYAFGITGYHYLALYKALKDSSIKYISVKHENAASLSALQYARIAQKPALIMGTAGPGATNLITGICEMLKSNLPGFIITPIPPTNIQGKNASQEDSGIGNSYSISGIMTHITKKSITCSNPQNIPDNIRDLFRVSLSGRKGPVHLLVPVNFFEQKINYNPVSPDCYRCTNDSSVDLNAIKNITLELKKCKKPLLLIGHRAWFPNISDSIKKFSDAYGIPVILSGGAKGLYDEFSPYFGGILDIYGHRSAEVLVKNSDLIISIGEDFGETTVNKYETDFFGDKLIQIDVDGYDIGRNYPVKYCACGNLGMYLEYLNNEMRSSNAPKFYDNSIKNLFEKENLSLTLETTDDSVPLKPQRILHEISRCAPANSFFISDMGRIGLFTMRNLRVSSNSYSLSLGNYTLAQAVGGSIGGKIALPNKVVSIICGDGAFLMHGMELATSQQYKLPILWFVFNDKMYGSVEWAQRLLYDDLGFCTELFVPDLSKFAEAFSIDYYKISDIQTLQSSISAAFSNYSARSASALIEIVFDQEEQLPLKPMMVKFIQEICNLQNFKTTPNFMKSFKRRLREKV